MSPDWSEIRQLVGRDLIADTNDPSRTWLQRFIHPDDQLQVMGRIKKAIATKSIFELEHRALRVDGSQGSMFTRAVPRFDDSGEIAEWVGMASDITESKRAETALQESEERLRLALAAGGMAVWDWEIDTGKVLWNDEHFTMLGYAPGSITPDYEAWRSRVVPEDLPRIEALLQQAVQLGKGYAAVYRILGKNNLIRWVEAHGGVGMERVGRSRRLFGVLSDITDRMVREQDLRQRLDEIEALYNNTPIGLTLLDRNLRYLRVNETMARINGCPAAAHYGRSVPDVLPGISPYVERKVAEVLSSGQIVKGETTTIMAGERQQRSFREVFYPLRDGAGSVSKVGIIVEDITEHRRAEEQTALLMKEVNHRAKNLLAVIQAIAQLTAEDVPPEAFYQSFSERLNGLAASHDLLVEANWQSVSLATLIKSQLPHFEALIGSRILIDGPSFELNPSAAQAIGMALHELGTNAAKHGALSMPDGRVKIGWSSRSVASGAEPRFVMTWTEEGGPPVAEPQRRGLGYAVTVNMPEHLLEADVSLSFLPRGIVWTLRAPVAHVGDFSGSEGDVCAS